MLINLPSPIAIVSHDAGSANHIIAWLKIEIEAISICVYMEGPAKKIWTDEFPGIELKNSLKEALTNAKTLLSGTGWASDLEYEARYYARQTGLKSVAMVDHWVNYEIRFIRGGIRILPDEIWVVDSYAYCIARTTFKGCQIRLQPDLYSQSILKFIQPVSKISCNQLLYILEPMRSEWGKDSAGEFQALDYMLERMSLLSLPEDTVILLRPHPSDPPNKYDRYINRSNSCQIVVDQGSLMDSLSRSKWVAGCESYALSLAIKAGRIVYCTLPPWAPPCRLPHEGLVHLKDV